MGLRDLAPGAAPPQGASLGPRDLAPGWDKGLLLLHLPPSAMNGARV